MLRIELPEAFPQGSGCLAEKLLQQFGTAGWRRFCNVRQGRDIQPQKWIASGLESLTAKVDRPRAEKLKCVEKFTAGKSNRKCGKVQGWDV